MNGLLARKREKHWKCSHSAPSLRKKMIRRRINVSNNIYSNNYSWSVRVRVRIQLIVFDKTFSLGENMNKLYCPWDKNMSFFPFDYYFYSFLERTSFVFPLFKEYNPLFIKLT